MLFYMPFSSIIIVFCVGLSLLFGSAQFVGRVQSRQLLLASFFSSLAVCIFYLWLFSESKLALFPTLFMAYVPATIVGSVSFFLFFKTYLEEREFTKSDWPHVIPVILSLISFIAFEWIDPLTKFTWINALYQGSHTGIFLPFSILSGGVATLYLVKTLTLNADYYSFDFRKRPGLTGFLILIAIVLASVLVIATLSVTFAITLTRWSLFIFSLIFLLASALHVRNPGYFSTWITDFKKSYQKRYYLNEINIKDIQTQLITLMTEEKIYQDNELTLEKLSGKLSISRYQLSQLLNAEMKTTFSRFVQTYRIQAAQHYLETQPNRTILSIAYEVGFNSNTSFQTAFKLIVGMTPSEFRIRNKYT